MVLTCVSHTHPRHRSLSHGCSAESTDVFPSGAGARGIHRTPGRWKQAVASPLRQPGISGLGTNLVIAASSLGEGRGMGTGMGTLRVGGD